MLHPRDPGGERLRGTRGESAARGRGVTRRPLRFAPLRSARRQRSGGAACALLLPPAKPRCRPGSCTAPRRRPDTAPQRSAGQGAGGGAMQNGAGSQPMGMSGGGDMQSCTPGGQWHGALRQPPLPSLRGAAPRRAVRAGRGRGSSGPAVSRARPRSRRCADPAGLRPPHPQHLEGWDSPRCKAKMG